MLYSEILHFVRCVDHCPVKMMAVYLLSSTRFGTFYLLIYS
jgi:hypothetical protein